MLLCTKPTTVPDIENDMSHYIRYKLAKLKTFRSSEQDEQSSRTNCTKLNCNSSAFYLPIVLITLLPPTLHFLHLL